MKYVIWNKWNEINENYVNIKMFHLYLLIALKFKVCNAVIGFNTVLTKLHPGW